MRSRALILAFFIFSVSTAEAQPRIDRIRVDEKTSRLIILGDFSQTQGIVTVQDSALPILSWSSSGVEALLPISGESSAGRIRVIDPDGVSNQKVLSKLSLQISRSFQEYDSVHFEYYKFSRASWGNKLSFRLDFHDLSTDTIVNYQRDKGFWHRVLGPWGQEQHFPWSADAKGCDSCFSAFLTLRPADTTFVVAVLYSAPAYYGLPTEDFWISKRMQLDVDGFASGYKLQDSIPTAFGWKKSDEHVYNIDVLYPAEPLDSTLPHINHLTLDESTSTLLVHGRKLSVVDRLLLNGNSIIFDSEGDSLLAAQIEREGSMSIGIVQVIQGGFKSNSRTLSRVKATLTRVFYDVEWDREGRHEVWEGGHKWMSTIRVDLDPRYAGTPQIRSFEWSEGGHGVHEEGYWYTPGGYRILTLPPQKQECDSCAWVEGKVDVDNRLLLYRGMIESHSQNSIHPTSDVFFPGVRYTLNGDLDKVTRINGDTYQSQQNDTVSLDSIENSPRRVLAEIRKKAPTSSKFRLVRDFRNLTWRVENLADVRSDVAIYDMSGRSLNRAYIPVGGQFHVRQGPVIIRVDGEVKGILAPF